MADGIYWQLAAGNADRLAQLPQQFYQGRQLRQQQDVLNARQEAGQLFSQGDNRSALARLAGVGDFQGVGVLNQIDQQGLPAGFRRTAAGLEPITGGPADPNYQRTLKTATAEAVNPTWGKIGVDQNGQDIMGWINPTKQTVTPYQQPNAQPQALNIPAAPPGVDPKVWRQKLAEEKVKEYTNAPNVMRTADSMIATVDSVLNDPSLPWATGIYSPLQKVPGTGPYRFGTKAAQLQGQAFLQAFESLKGGGAITQVEGEKATAAIARMNTAQNEKDYRDALNELKSTLVSARNRQQTILNNVNRPQQNVQQQQPQVSEGAIIVNPQTGERRQLRGGQWLPVQ